MSEQQVRLGLDCRGDTLYAARVNSGSGRPEIKALLRAPAHTRLDHDLTRGAERSLAIPEDLVVTRRHHLPPPHDTAVDKKALFEISSSILGDISDFYVDLVRTPVENQLISLTARRKLIEAYRGSVMDSEEKLAYRMRALALGRGYLNFCDRVPGELVCVADCNRRTASICLVYREQVVSLFGIGVSRYDPSEESGRRKIAFEFNTLIRYQLENLFNQGITVPLSAVVAGGEFGHEEFSSGLGERLGVDVNVLKINPGYFADRESVTSGTVQDYIVALGLTVD